jgi:hypothetical protein
VDFGEKVGNPLDLIDDDPSPMTCRNQAFKALRVGCQAGKKLGLQEVNINGLGKCPADPSRLSGTSGAKEKEALSFGRL